MRSATRTLLWLSSLTVFAFHFCYSHSRDEPDIYKNLYIENIKVNPQQGYTVTVSPSIIKDSGDTVTVKWSNIESPSSEDFLAFYAPPEILTTSAINQTVPITFQYAYNSPSHLSTGGGALEFRVLNLREDYAVGLFRGGLEAPELVALSNVLVVAGKELPTGVHTAFAQGAAAGDGGDGGGGDGLLPLRVTWSARASVAPAVRYQKLTADGHPDGQIFEVSADSNTFTREDLCGAPAATAGFHDPGRVQTSVLGSLQPEAQYVYWVGDHGTGLWGSARTLRAPPLAGGGRRRLAAEGGGAAWAEEEGRGGGVRFALFADMGTARPDGSHHGIKEEFDAIKSMALIKHQHALGRGLDFVMHVGDVSYADGYLARWDEFLMLIEPVASEIPWMTAAGNHERDTTGTSRRVPARSFWEAGSSGGECGVPYAAHFPTGGPDADADAPWYSFESGPVHITVISSEHDFTMGSNQYQWIKSDFENVDRKVTPWLIFASHRPLYVHSEGAGSPEEDQDAAALLRLHLEPLLLAHRVDLAAYGHHHSYQRTCPLAAGACQQPRGGRRAPVHLVAGMAGRSLSTNVDAASLPAWLEAFNNEEHGVLFVEADYSSLTVKFYADCVDLTSNYNPESISKNVEEQLETCIRDEFTLEK